MLLQHFDNIHHPLTPSTVSRFFAMHILPNFIPSSSPPPPPSHSFVNPLNRIILLVYT